MNHIESLLSSVLLGEIIRNPIFCRDIAEIVFLEELLLNPSNTESYDFLFHTDAVTHMIDENASFQFFRAYWLDDGITFGEEMIGIQGKEIDFDAWQTSSEPKYYWGMSNIFFYLIKLEDHYTSKILTDEEIEAYEKSIKMLISQKKQRLFEGIAIMSEELKQGFKEKISSILSEEE